MSIVRSPTLRTLCARKLTLHPRPLAERVADPCLALGADAPCFPHALIHGHGHPPTIVMKLRSDNSTAEVDTARPYRLRARSLTLLQGSSLTKVVGRSA